ncbi:Uma2 family endonuclease [Geminocystis sp.]|uniref:Uma2 family endonuclease n=1 Tax=Geminocystis sp. TaxID=2664100 RepID=UPI0035930246
MDTVILNLENVGITDDQFYSLCQVNPHWNLEINKQGELIIMPPIGGLSGKREADLISLLWLWNNDKKLGIVFSSSTIFCLQNGAKRSPDVAYIKLENWQKLTLPQQEKFPPICPDFVIELRSKTDSLKPLQEKMKEYLESGLQLGWLINPQKQEVEIYRPNQTTEIVFLPAILSGENILPEFTLNLPIYN